MQGLPKSGSTQSVVGEGVGARVGVGVTVGSGEGVDVGVGEGVGVAVGAGVFAGDAFFFTTPLFQTNFFPDFMQVNLFP